MSKTAETKAPKQNYLGIIFIGGGSSWQHAPTIGEAVNGAKRRLELDWGPMCTFDPDKPAHVNLYDATNATEGWFADHHGVTDRATEKPLPFIEAIKVFPVNTPEQKTKKKKGPTDMNKTQRAELKKAGDLVSQALAIAETLLSEQQEKYDEMSEKAQEGEKGQALQEEVSNLEELHTNLESADSAIGGFLTGE